MPRYTLKTVETEIVDVHDFNAAVWEPGDRIPMPPGPNAGRGRCAAGGR
jgi:hypothetical protein